MTTTVENRSSKDGFASIIVTNSVAVWIMRVWRTGRIDKLLACVLRHCRHDALYWERNTLHFFRRCECRVTRNRPKEPRSRNGRATLHVVLASVDVAYFPVLLLLLFLLLFMQVLKYRAAESQIWSSDLVAKHSCRTARTSPQVFMPRIVAMIKGEWLPHFERETTRTVEVEEVCFCCCCWGGCRSEVSMMI